MSLAQILRQERLSAAARIRYPPAEEWNQGVPSLGLDCTESLGMHDGSLKMARKTGLSWCCLWVALLAIGCRSTSERQANLASELTSPEEYSLEKAPSPWETMTFFHKAKFQKRTGPVDATEASEFSATDSGLRYRILRQSSGKKPAVSNTVTVNYRGWLNSGKVFDSSYERGEPTTFPLGGVIAGWTEGMQLVGEGGMIELWIPSKLGYGERGSPGSIPPHSHLHFIVELIDVK